MGVEIRFVKKSKSVSAIHLNDVDEVNKAWSDSKVEKLFYSKEVLLFYNNIVDILKKKVNAPVKHVLDVGCGTGTLLNYLSTHFEGVKLSGMEYSSAALDIASKKNPNARYILHDINEPFEEKFDLILSTEVLEHILYPKNALKNLIAMLQQGGYLFLSVPNGRIDTFEGHINFWSIESWEVFVKENIGKFRFETGMLGERNLYAIIYI